MTVSKNSAISLREVTRDTVREITRLKVTPAQESFVASNAVSIAQAYFDREKAWFRAIYADETPVGFLMLADKPDEPEYYLWRLMIDEKYQKMGFGQQAVELLVEHVRTRPNATELVVSCVPAEGGPQAFYEKLGFVSTGEMHDSELVLKRPL